MHTVTHSEFFGWETTVKLDLSPKPNEPLHGLCGWFDVRFCGSGKLTSNAPASLHGRALAPQHTVGFSGPVLSLPPPPPRACPISEENPADECVELDTAPTSPSTHWAQTTLLLERPITEPELTVRLAQRGDSHHDLNVTVSSGDWSASYAITSEFRGMNLDA